MNTKQGTSELISINYKVGILNKRYRHKLPNKGLHGGLAQLFTRVTMNLEGNNKVYSYSKIA